MFGGAMTWYGCWLLGGLCVSHRKPNIRKCPIFLLTCFYICREEDSRIWKPSTFGVFTITSFCATLEESSHDRVSSALAWAGLVPPWVEACCWLVITEKVSIACFLQRNGLHPQSISDVCVMCGAAEECTHHLFIYCKVASFILSHVPYWCGIAFYFLRKGVPFCRKWFVAF